MNNSNDELVVPKHEVVETIPEIKIQPTKESSNHHSFNHSIFAPMNSVGTVNIPPPAIPANDMIKLEAHHPGAIDRILRMSEKEQDFSHSIIRQDQNDQTKITDRDIIISKEQYQHNTAKLIIVVALLFLLIGGAIYLFILDKVIGGVGLLILASIVGSIFVLGDFPIGVFESIFGNQKGKSSDEIDKIENRVE